MFQRLLLTGAIALTCVSLSDLSLIVIALYLVCLIVAWSFKQGFSKLNDLPALLLGILIPLAPMLGPGTLIAIVLVYLFFKSFAGKELDLSWGFPYLLVTFAWVFAVYWWHFDYKTVAIIYSGGTGPGGGGIRSLYEWLRQSPPDWLIVSQVWIRVGIFFALSSFLQSETKDRTDLIRGILIGLCPAFFLTLLQLYDPTLSIFINQTSFWTGQNRITGTFSDPNAFGLFVVLSLPLFYSQFGNSKKRFFMLTFGAAWAILAFFSGSRCFFLGLILYALFFLYRRSAKLLGLALIALGFFIILANSGLISDVRSLPVTLSRVLESVQEEHIASAFHSRIVFSKLGLAIWLDHPLFGIGFNNFRNFVVPYAQSLNLGTGLWIDNSNNFYLGVLAETGILGIVALLSVITSLRTNVNGYIFRAGIYCLSILMLLGPHLDFDEISLLGATLLSLGFTSKPAKLIRMCSYALSPIIFVILIIRESTLEGGLYAWEQERNASYRWTERKSIINVTCQVEDKQAHFWLRATEPNIGVRPVNVLIQSSEHTQQLTLNSFDWNKVSLPCEENHTEAISIEVDRLWTPKLYKLGADSRILAVQVSKFDPYTKK